MLPSPAKHHGRRRASRCAPPPPRRRACGASPGAPPARCSAGGSARLRWNWLHRFVGGQRRLGAVAEPVDHEQRAAPSASRVRRPGVAADLLARHWRRSTAPSQVARIRRRTVAQQAREHRGAARPARRRREHRCAMPAHGAEAVARRAGGRVAVGQAALDVGHAGAAIERQQLEPCASPRTDQQLAAAAVLDQVGRQLGGDQRQLARARLVEARRCGRAPSAARRASATWRCRRRPATSIIVISSARCVTRVPCPTATRWRTRATAAWRRPGRGPARRRW